MANSSARTALLLFVTIAACLVVAASLGGTDTPPAATPSAAATAASLIVPTTLGVGATGSPVRSAKLTQSMVPTRAVNALTSTRVLEAVTRCNADPKNSAKGSPSCLLLEDAVITVAGRILFDPKAGRNADIFKLMDGGTTPTGPFTFPFRGKSRHHMRPVKLEAVTEGQTIADAMPAATEVGVYQEAVIGAMYLNMWHSFSDFCLMLFHTVSIFVAEPGVETPLTWVTATSRETLGSGCGTATHCLAKSLFKPFRLIFSDRIVFVGDVAAPIRFRYLIIGINTRCSPVPTEAVGVPVCQQNIRAMRDFFLRRYGFDARRRTRPADARCPSVHVMSRQNDKYRRITPFDAMMAALRAAYTARGCDPGQLHIVSLTNRMSFGDQIATIANSTVLLAGRGGGTGLSIFLPVGGGYLSVSGDDEWNPYRDLVPAWITLQHYRAKLVHHENHNKPPQLFGKKGYVDANRCGYVVQPDGVVAAFNQLVARMTARNDTAR
jgi:hypothetical protein